MKSSGEKKKVARRKKISAAEKRLIRLEKESDALRRSGAQFLSFLDTVERWFSKNARKIEEFFQKVDSTGEGHVSAQDFTAGLLDLLVPCNEVELYLLAKMLDVDDTGLIDVRSAVKILRSTRATENLYGMDEINPGLHVTQPSRCSCCDMSVCVGEQLAHRIPRFINVTFRLASFDGFRTHQGHFSKIVQSTDSVKSLVAFIQEESGISSRRMAIFRDISREPSSRLEPHKTLDDYDFESGPKHNPASLVLFYDYIVEFKDCPILVCDHYFGRKFEKAKKDV